MTRSCASKASRVAGDVVIRADTALGNGKAARALRRTARGLANPTLGRGLMGFTAGVAAAKAYRASPCTTQAGKVVHAGMAAAVGAGMSTLPFALADMATRGQVGKAYEGFVASFAAGNEDVVQELRGRAGTATDGWMRRAKRGDYGTAHRGLVAAGESVADPLAEGARRFVDLQKKYSLPAVVVAGVRKLKP